MSTSILVLLAIGTIVSAVALALDISSASQNNRRKHSRTRAGVTSALTVIAVVALVGSLACASIEHDAISATFAPPLERVAATVLALALAIVGGGPFAVLSLRLATRGQTRQGLYGGILIQKNGHPNQEPPSDPLPSTKVQRLGLFGRRRVPLSPTPKKVTTTSPAQGTQAMGTNTIEVLRGGTTIGLLERVAIAGAIIAGFPEAVAVVIAIKGVGRFSELAASEAKERFIIGTLASFVWASACALVLR